MTQRCDYRAIVKEGAAGHPSIALEPSGIEPSALKGKQIAMELKRGTTLEQARALVREMDKLVVGLAIT